MQLYDTHSHLHFPVFDNDRAAVYARSKAAGVSFINCVGTTLEDSAKALAYANDHALVWAAIGVHPHAAENFLNSENSQHKLSNLLGESKVIAVGETGLDYYKSTTPKKIQQAALRVQLEAGLKAQKPFIFHVRDAFADFWNILDGYQGVTGVIHSFSSGVNQLDAALERGLYIGLNGIMTFTSDPAQLVAAKLVPNDRLLLETDAPFLAPIPFRGNRCEPAHTKATAEFLAKLRGQLPEDLASTTTANARKLFNI